MANWIRFFCFQLPLLFFNGVVRIAGLRRMRLFNSSRDDRWKQWWRSSKKRQESFIEKPRRSLATESSGSSLLSLGSASVERSHRQGASTRRNTIGHGRGKQTRHEGKSPGTPSNNSGGKKGGGGKGGRPAGKGPPPPPAGKGPPAPPGGKKGAGGGKGAANTAGKSLVNQFKDGLWKDFVEATKPKSTAPKSDNADKGQQRLKCPLDDKTFQQVAFWERNPYFQKKLKAQSGNWYNAMVSTVAGLCSDVQGDLRDECGGIFEYLGAVESGSDEKTPKWETTFIANADAIRATRQQFQDAGKYSKECEAAGALVDLYKTHGKSLTVHSAADDFLSAAKKTKSNWEEFASEFENVLSEEDFKKAVVANCRVMPGVLGLEHKVSALDCVSRLSESVSDMKFLQARCIALAGPRAWTEHEIPTNLWKAGSASNKSRDACAEVYRHPWTAEGLEPTQESLSCARILPYSLQDATKKPLDMVDGLHFRFPSELLKNRKGLIFSNPTSSEEAQKIYDFKSQEDNSWMAEEDTVRKNWPTLLASESQLMKACQSAQGGMADACGVTRTALAEIRRQAIQMTGASEEQLSDLDSVLFSKEKSSAKEILVRVLTEYRAIEDVLAQAKADKEKGTDPAEAPKSKAARELAKAQGAGQADDPKAPSKPSAPGKGGKGAPPPAPGKGGGKKGAPPAPAPPGGKGPPAPKGGGKGPPAPAGGKGGAASVSTVQNFTPTQLPANTEITVWRWLEQGVKLWRAIFDDSRKERGSLILKWSENMPKFQKCSFMTRCLEFPDVMMSIEVENNQAQATTKKDYLKTTCSEYCRQLDVRVVDCTSPEKNRACSSPLQSKEGVAERLKDAPMTSAVWCDPAPDALKRSVFYAAAEAVEQVKKSRRKPFVADMVRIMDLLNGGEEPTTLMTDSAVEKIWKLPPEKVGEVVVRIENGRK